MSEREREPLLLGVEYSNDLQYQTAINLIQSPRVDIFQALGLLGRAELVQSLRPIEAGIAVSRRIESAD